MRLRAVLMLGMAIVLAAGAVFLAQDWLRKQSKPAAVVTTPETLIVVARHALDFGAIIRKEHLRQMAWPRRSIPEGAFSSIDEVVGNGKPRVALRRIEANEPVLKSKVSGFGGRASLSTIIAEGMRAATIRVNDVNGVAGFVLPGDRVDILLTRDPTGGRRRNSKNLVTDVLLQNIKVLAIDQDRNENKEKPSVAKAVTLEVTPLQTQKLALAQNVGTLSLALRNVNNSSAAAWKSVKLRDLRTGEASTNSSGAKAVEPTVRIDAGVKPANNHSTRRVSTIRVFRGVTTSEYEVKREHTAPAAGGVSDRPTSPHSGTDAQTDGLGVTGPEDRRRAGDEATEGAPQPPAESGPTSPDRRRSPGDASPSPGQEAMLNDGAAPGLAR